MPNLTIALDRSSRRLDADGRLHVDRSHISKAGVNPYYGKEIPEWESLGLEADKIYRLLRDPVELDRGAHTFARLPILKEHVPVTVDAPRPDLVVGAIGSEIAFNSPYLDADICVWDGKAIAGIETDKVRELSCAYRYVPVMEAGAYEGVEYDGRMTEIRGNHLALVEIGRAGNDVVVADSNPFIKTEEIAMKMSKLGKALFAALVAASPVLAADSALPALVGTANRKTFQKDAVKAKLLALDASLDSNKLDDVLDAIMDVETDPKPAETPMAAADESPADKLRALLSGKVDDATMQSACALLAPAAAAAADEFPDAKKDDKKDKPVDVKAAMDAFGVKLRAEMADANIARVDVRATVGDVLGMDSAADIYGFALDHMKVDRKDVTGVPALRALYKVASSKSASVQPIAQDSAGAVVKFPGAARFRNA
jgi:hypothetical protein